VAGLDVSLPLDDAERHEVEDVFRIARLYGIDGAPPPCRVVAGAVSPAPAASRLRKLSPLASTSAHANHRSAGRRALRGRHASALPRKRPARFLLLWSPGDDDNPLHPGDDAKAREVMQESALARSAIPGRGR
jgi:heptosyltransferase-3